MYPCFFVTGFSILFLMVSLKQTNWKILHPSSTVSNPILLLDSLNFVHIDWYPQSQPILPQIVYLSFRKKERMSLLWNPFKLIWISNLCAVEFNLKMFSKLWKYRRRKFEDLICAHFEIYCFLTLFVLVVKCFFLNSKYLLICWPRTSARTMQVFVSSIPAVLRWSLIFLSKWIKQRRLVAKGNVSSRALFSANSPSVPKAFN